MYENKRKPLEIIISIFVLEKIAKLPIHGRLLVIISFIIVLNVVRRKELGDL